MGVSMPCGPLVPVEPSRKIYMACSETRFYALQAFSSCGTVSGSKDVFGQYAFLRPASL